MKPPAFCLLHCSCPAPSPSARRAIAATCAAIALVFPPCLRSTRAAPSSIPRRPHQQQRTSTNDPPQSISPPTIILVKNVSIPSLNPPSDPPLPPITASALVDKDYIQAPLWQFDNRPLRARMSLPPRPETSAEVRILTRLIVALVVGGSIGMERRAANSLAGVRTFSLVSLGAAIFMTTTLVALPDSDPARVAAAISSSVGFLGAGAMSKNSKPPRGLTTASSVWLAAALGIAAACGMFLLSFAGAVSTVLIARYARFDSSLHLIREREDLAERNEEEKEDAMIEGYENMAPRRYANGFEYYGENGRYIDSQGRGLAYKYETRRGVPRDPVHLQALVDFDPSSQGGGAADEKPDEENGSEHDRGSGD